MARTGRGCLKKHNQIEGKALAFHGFIVSALNLPNVLREITDWLEAIFPMVVRFQPAMWKVTEVGTSSLQRLMDRGAGWRFATLMMCGVLPRSVSVNRELDSAPLGRNNSSRGCSVAEPTV